MAVAMPSCSPAAESGVRTVGLSSELLNQGSALGLILLQSPSPRSDSTVPAQFADTPTAAQLHLGHLELLPPATSIFGSMRHPSLVRSTEGSTC